jgi:hypothetical protein
MSSASRWLLGLLTLLPLGGMACEMQDHKLCEKQFVELVSHRAEAIDYAFGNVSAGVPAHIDIRFVGPDDPEYKSLGGTIAYLPDTHTLIFPRKFTRSKVPNPLRWASYYWPYYQSAVARRDFPVIETIDNGLWSSYLQEAARARGLTWPHKECESVDVGTRLPCEMLQDGIVEQLKAEHTRLFNSNRVDRIWPENFTEFQKRVWRDDLEYADVQRYGGIALVRPLVGEFGVPRVLTYIAQTPFRVEDGNMRTSAMQYQERARQILSVQSPHANANASANVATDGAKQTHSTGVQ